MKHYAAREYWVAYHSLPAEIRGLTDKAFVLLKSDSRHPSLHFKKTQGFWSVRVGLHYRAIAVDVPGGILCFWIGSHAEYDGIVG